MSDASIPDPEAGNRTTGQIARRGLVASTAALVVALLGKASERTAQAGHQPVGTPGTTPGIDSVALHLNAGNTSAGSTTLTTASGIGLEVTSSSSIGIRGTTTIASIGVDGSSPSNAGVRGTSNSSIGV